MTNEIVRVHWMDIGIEEKWAASTERLLPVISISNDYKVIDSERLSIFWGGEENIVILRSEPPAIWLDYLSLKGFILPKFQIVGREFSYFDKKMLHSITLDLLDNGIDKSQILLQPYVVTKDAVEFGNSENIRMENSEYKSVHVLNGKIAQREFLELNHIPVPKAIAFHSVSKLEEWFERTEEEAILGHIIKFPYGASGKGVVRLDKPSDIKRFRHFLSKRGSKIEKFSALVEKWYEAELNFSYQLNIGAQSNPEPLFLKEQLLSNQTVFVGFRYPLILSPELQQELTKYVCIIYTALYEKGIRGFVSIDGIVTKNGDLIPSIDLNVRFSLSTYFNKYLELNSTDSVLIRYYDIGENVSLESILSIEKNMNLQVMNEIVVASISDIGGDFFRRAFLIFKSDTMPCALDLSVNWERALEKLRNQNTENGTGK